MLTALALMLAAPAPAAASDARLCFGSAMIWFGRGKARLTPQAVQHLAFFLRDSQQAAVPPTYEVEGGGDAMPGHPFDRRLAVRRASTMKSFLVQHGVPPARIKIVIGQRLRFTEFDDYSIELSDAGHARAFAPFTAVRKLYPPGSIIECL